MATRIVFPSLTHAQKGLRVLERAGIRARLTKDSRQGCRYGILISESPPEKALSLLSQAGLSYSF